MSEQSVIDKFLILKSEIKDFPNNRDEFWRTEATQIIEKYIGINTSQYNLVAGHTFHPNGPVETEQSQRERGEAMIDSCINYIKLHGIANQRLDAIPDILPQTNAITKQTTKYHIGTWVVKILNNDWVKLIATGLIVIFLGTWLLVKYKVIK